MSKEMEFFIYLLIYYAHSKGLKPPDVYQEWQELGLVQKIFGQYDFYHVERLENAFEDIDEMIQEVKLKT